MKTAVTKVIDTLTQEDFHGAFEDNALVDNSILVTDYLTKMGIKTFPQPPYSSDLAPCDFCLFPKLKEKLRGCRYEIIEEMKEAVTKVIDTLTQEDFHGAFEDNALVDNSILVTDYLTKMGIKTFPQPPYSSDLAPCDFCLFPKLKEKLRGCRYEIIEEMKEAVTKVIDTLTQEDFHGAFEDNALVDNSILVTDYLTKMGIKTFPQPPYSSDLAPCDFCLFPKLKEKLRGCRYEIIEEMKEAVTKVIDTLT